MPIKKLATKFAHSRSHSFPVVDQEGDLKGIVSLSDLEAHLTHEGQNLTVKQILTTNLITAYPDESLHEVLHRIGDKDLARIPVVDRTNPFRIVGVLRRNDIVTAYTRAISKSEKTDSEKLTTR